MFSHAPLGWAAALTRKLPITSSFHLRGVQFFALKLSVRPEPAPEAPWAPAGP